MISVVIPTYKERANIERLVERAGAALSQCGEEYELIIVDDGSPDGTGDEVLRLAESRPWLRLLLRENERDLSTAVIAGWRIARGDVFGCMDADLQHPPELLPALLASLRSTGADIVVGSRHVPGGGVNDWSLARRIVSWTATLMATVILPGTLGRVKDPMSGFFMVRRRVLDNAVLKPIGYKILIEVLAKGNYGRIVEFPFVFEEREKGGSKMNLGTVRKYLAHLLRISVDSGEALRVFKYGLVGAAGAGVNFLASRWLVWGAHWSLPAGLLGGAVIALLSNFLLNDRFTFVETRRAHPGWTRTLGRFFAFAAFCGTGVAIYFAVSLLLHTTLGLSLGFSLVVGIGIAAIWNFLLNSNVTWQAWWDRKLLTSTEWKPERP
jgi:dolichol-phosphate mannosyltransferase